MERLRTMTLREYTAAGDKDCFVYWLEFRLADCGSIAGGSAFKFAIFSRKATTDNVGDTSLAYDANYGWYRRFGDTPEVAFEAIREHVVAVAEAARDGRLEDIDSSPLGAVRCELRKTRSAPSRTLSKARVYLPCSRALMH